METVGVWREPPIIISISTSLTERLFINISTKKEKEKKKNRKKTKKASRRNTGAWFDCCRNAGFDWMLTRFLFFFWKGFYFFLIVSGSRSAIGRLPLPPPHPTPSSCRWPRNDWRIFSRRTPPLPPTHSPSLPLAPLIGRGSRAVADWRVPRRDFWKSGKSSRPTFASDSESLSISTLSTLIC